MVSPNEALESVARAIANSGELPSELSLLLQEADTAFEDSDVDLPLLEIQIEEADDVIVNNSEFVDYIIDDSGNRVGRRYLSEYEMVLQLQLWTVSDGGYDVDDLGNRLRKALYPYSSYGPGRDFTDETGNSIESITWFDVGVGERTDDLIQTPTVRRWSQTVELWSYEEFNTTEDYIIDVNTPSDGDLNDTDGDGTTSNT